MSARIGSIGAFLFLYAKMRVNNESQFLEKFNDLLEDVFILTPFNYKEKLNIKIELTCKTCGHVQKRNFYNVFKSKNCKSCLGVKNSNERNKHKLLTRDEFILKLPNGFNYEVLDKVINTNKKVNIRDEFGLCKVIGRNLIKGSEPSIQSAVDSTAYRIAMFNKIHNFKYTYPDYIFTKNSAKINFVCPIHGNQTIIETNHMKGFGCKGCTKKGAPKMSDEEFLRRIKENNPNIEILEERGEYHTPILCRNKYGLVRVSPDHLLKGSIGSLKSALDKTSYMIEQFKEKHDNKYLYPNYQYCGNRCKAEIECPIHGSFHQLTDVHLMGSGCTPCSFLDSNRIRGYGRNDFIKTANGRECTLYIVLMNNQKESFYKIGITSKTTDERLTKPCDIKYTYNIIYEYKNFDAGFIWDLEKKLHKENKLLHYKPEIYFKGITECFNLSLPIQKIIDYLKNN